MVLEGSDKPIHRYEERFPLQDPAGAVIRATLMQPPDVTDQEEASACERKELTGQIVELSGHGLRCYLDGRPSVGSWLKLEVSIAAVDVQLVRPAVVRRIDPRDTDGWSVGCELQEGIPEELLGRMAKAGVLNRRRDPRYETNKPVQLRRPLSEESFNATLINFSKGGFCAVVSEPVDLPAGRVLLRFPVKGSTVRLAATVVWQRCREDGSYAVGCSFSDTQGFIRLREFTGVSINQFDKPEKPFVEKTRLSFWIAVAAVVILLLQIWHLLHAQTPGARAIRQLLARPIVKAQLSSPTITSQDAPAGSVAANGRTDRSGRLGGALQLGE